MARFYKLSRCTVPSGVSELVHGDAYLVALGLSRMQEVRAALAEIMLWCRVWLTGRTGANELGSKYCHKVSVRKRVRDRGRVRLKVRVRVGVRAEVF